MWAGYDGPCSQTAPQIHMAVHMALRGCQTEQFSTCQGSEPENCQLLKLLQCIHHVLSVRQANEHSLQNKGVLH